MRNTKSKLSCSLIAALGWILSSQTARAQEYKIKFDRSAKAGDQYTTSATATVKNHALMTMAGGAPPQLHDENYTVDLQGVVTVVEVTEKHSLPKKLSCKVDHFTKDGKDLYPAGALIVVEHTDGKLKYSVDGKSTPPQDVEMYIAVLPPTGLETDVTEDQSMGTDKPQKVGDSWPVDSDLSAQAINTGEMKVAASDVKGECKLVKVKKLNGAPVMVVGMNTTINKFSMDIPMLGKANGDAMTVEQTTTLPVDETKPLISRTQKAHLSMKVDLPNAMGTMDMTGDQDSTIRNEPVK